METEEERENTVKNEENEEESDEESGCAVFSSSPLTPEDPSSSPCSQPALIDLSVSHGKSFWVSAVVCVKISQTVAVTAVAMSSVVDPDPDPDRHPWPADPDRDPYLFQPNFKLSYTFS